MNSERERWDARYRAATGPGAPARALTEFAHLLPLGGRALDLACGLGANALFLARRGFQVAAWDLSPVAITRLRKAAAGLSVAPEVRDAVASPPSPQSFEVVVVHRFLERALAPAIAGALTPGGMLFYQTFTRERVTPRGPQNPAYRLAPNELLGLFPGLRVRAYREEGTLGDTDRGLRDEALLVAERPLDDTP